MVSKKTRRPNRQARKRSIFAVAFGVQGLRKAMNEAETERGHAKYTYLASSFESGMEISSVRDTMCSSSGPVRRTIVHLDEKRHWRVL